MSEMTFKPKNYNKRDNRSRTAILKKNNGVLVCEDKELNKGGPQLEVIIYTHLAYVRG